MWGNTGVTREACLAASRVIITTESIVPTDVITSDPNRVITPGFLVSAVVHAPWGAHPSPVPGFYNRDHQVFIDYRNDSTTPEGFNRWLNRWVLPVHHSDDYIQMLGKERIASLLLKNHAYTEAADYGY